MLKNPNPKTEVAEAKADAATIAAGAVIETKAPVPAIAAKVPVAHKARAAIAAKVPVAHKAKAAIAAKVPVAHKAPATETPKQVANKRQAAPDKQVPTVANANGKQCSSR